MNYFLDTSAIIKRYVQEKETQAIQKIFIESNEIYISSITEIEIVPTFKRLLVESKISTEQFEFLLNILEEDFEDFIVVPFSNEVVKIAKLQIKKYQLKTLDSIQLASYLTLDFKNIPFIVYDEKLFNSAFKETQNVLKPLS